MAEHNDTGRWGEEKAQAFLKEQGYTILQCNWRFRREEVDIIAEKGIFLVFVEVKTRAYSSSIGPREVLTRAKQRHLIEAAHAYIERYTVDKDCRFDLIFITTGSKGSIEHIEAAFYPTA